MNNVNDFVDLIHKTTVTFSCPLALALWLKQTQRNCSAYIVKAVEAKRKQEAEEAGVEETTARTD